MATNSLTLSLSDQPAIFNAYQLPSLPNFPDNKKVVSPDGNKAMYNYSGINDDDIFTIENKIAGKSINYEKDLITFWDDYDALTFSTDSKYGYYAFTPYASESTMYLMRVDVDKMDRPYSIGSFYKHPKSFELSDDKLSFIISSVFYNEVRDSPPTNFVVAVNTKSGAFFDLVRSSPRAGFDGQTTEWHVVAGGKFAAFVSTTSNLVAGDTNGAADVFLRNLETGEITLVSRSAAGVQGNGASGGLDVSADGTKLLFHSDASNLVAGDTNGVRDVFVRDIATGAVTLVSTSASGKAGNGASENGAFSPDGRSVAFQSAATNLAPNDGNGSVDVFVKNLDTGTVLPLSYLYDDGAVTSVSVTGKPVFSQNGGIVSFGQYAYALDTEGLVILDVTRNLRKEDLTRISISKGDGSALEYSGFSSKTGETGIGSMLKVGLDYDRDGDFRATVTGLKDNSSEAVTTLTFDVKVRSHAGSQDFKGNGSGEVVVLSARDDKADGAAGDDVLIGAAGDDLLNGGTGADRLVGGTGNDTLVVDDARDLVFEAKGGGTDKVLSSVSYTLSTGQEVEALQLLSSTGKSTFNLTGNEFGQSLVGNNGANLLDGRGGADTMNGRGGNDTYIVDNRGDRVIEAAGGGNDKVLSSVSYALSAGQEVEALQLLSSTGRAALDLTGNAFGQTLVGNNGANTLNGGLGNDVLIGRGGADTFVFATALGGSNLDRIADFSSQDTIRLSKSVFAALGTGELAESAFKDIGTTKLDADDRILYDSRNGNLFYDADGSGKGAAVGFAVLANKAALTHEDVFVV